MLIEQREQHNVSIQKWIVIGLDLPCYTGLFPQNNFQYLMCNTYLDFGFTFIRLMFRLNNGSKLS